MSDKQKREWSSIGVGEGDSKPYLQDEGCWNKGYERKQAPIFSGVLNYFPDALWLVAKCSKTGNDQHNAGEPLHWAREKSTDESDCLVRHLMQYDQLDDDGILHAAKVAWRALALLQRTLEDRGEAPISPYNKKSCPDGKCEWVHANQQDKTLDVSGGLLTSSETDVCSRCGDTREVLNTRKEL
jgi:hypothetical protein